MPKSVIACHLTVAVAEVLQESEVASDLGGRGAGAARLTGDAQGGYARPFVALVLKPDVDLVALDVQDLGRAMVGLMRWGQGTLRRRFCARVRI